MIMIKKKLGYSKEKSYINTIDNKLLNTSLNKNFFPTSNFENISKHDIIIICVPTPLGKNKSPNLEYVSNVIKDIKKLYQKRSNYNIRVYFLSWNYRRIFPSNI